MTTQTSLFTLYKSCFPHIIRDDDTVQTVLSFPENHVITEESDGKLIGAAVINQNSILMLCVLPSHRNKGIGTKLLDAAEQYVKDSGFDEIKFCDGKDYITPGVPMFGAYEGNEEFLKKRGYVHSWDDAECVDMSMNLSDFCCTEKVVGDTVGGVLYRWAEKADFDGVIDCVDDGNPEFTEYYRDDFLYEDSEPFNERILIAEKDGKVCGALLVSNGTDAEGLGSVGCTVTRTDYRRQGIATNMVMIGTHHLKSIGLEKAFLGYTYTDIIPMYGRSGYKVCMKYFMGVKKI